MIAEKPYVGKPGVGNRVARVQADGLVHMADELASGRSEQATWEAAQAEKESTERGRRR